MTDGDNWLDPIVRGAIDGEIDKLAKGREHIVNARSRELLHAVVHNVVLDVLAVILSDDFDPNEATRGKG